jgi:NADP-dependent 3-hydroxy acid dehydrogenase YdfG
MRQQGHDVHWLPLAVDDPESIQSLYLTIEKEWKRLDVLVNNAGILLGHSVETNQWMQQVEN